MEEAVREGFTAYGISSHAPLPFTAKWSIAPGRVEEYLDEFNRLKARYADRIELYVAMEVDYLNDANGPAMPYFQRLPLDYRIGSVHIIPTPDGEMVDIDAPGDYFEMVWRQKFSGDMKRLVESYFTSMMRMIELGGFDFVGHADKVAFRVSQYDPSVLASDWYAGKAADLYALMAEKGLMAEINTKSYPEKGWFFPQKAEWAMLKRFRIPVLVNSDAHRPELINAGRMEALAALREAGFRTVMELHGGQWREESLI